MTLAAVLAAVSVVLAVAMAQWPLVVSYAAYAPLVVVAGLFLPLRWFLGVLGVVAVALDLVALPTRRRPSPASAVASSSWASSRR